MSQVTLARNRSLHFLDNHSVLLASPLQQTRPRQNNVGGAKGYGATRLSPPQRKKLPRDRLERARVKRWCQGVKLLLIDTANDTSGAWLPHLAARRFACGDQSGRTSALAGVTKISDPSRADHVVCPTDFWFLL